MRNRMYGGVRGRKMKVGGKLLHFPPTRLRFRSFYQLITIPTISICLIIIHLAKMVKFLYQLDNPLTISRLECKKVVLSLQQI